MTYIATLNIKIYHGQLNKRANVQTTPKQFIQFKEDYQDEIDKIKEKIVEDYSDYFIIEEEE